VAFASLGPKMGGGRLSQGSAMTEEKTASGHRNSHRGGRGAGENPPNRFDRLHLEPDPEYAQADPDDPDVPSPRTELYRDTSRTAIAYNQSPDVGFEASVNPYRGCEHGCIYCLWEDTPVLLADGSSRRIADLTPGDEIIGTVKRGARRESVSTTVLAHWRSEKPVVRVVLADGTVLLASSDHRFLTERGWKYVLPAAEGSRPCLTTRDRLRGVGSRGDSAMADSAVVTAVDLRVVSIRPLGKTLPMCDIQTGTGDFIANGVISHNCYARPTHEYLGLSSGLDFETKIFVKEDAPRLLRRELMAESWRPQVIAVSGVTDAYQPVERRLGITRKCLEVLAEFRNPLVIITKSRLVTRDIDVLRELAKYQACAVMVSVTTLRPEVQRVLEPRASSPSARLEAIRELAAAGIPVGVLTAPVIPGLTDHEIPAILDAAAAAGARRAGYVMLRLPFAVKSLFESWLERHFPERKSKILNRIRDMRGGKLNDPRFGSRMEGEGVFAEETAALFRIASRKARLDEKPAPLSTEHFRRPGWSQATLFDQLGLGGGGARNG
jgi:DNA repair photolyase